ncbi:Coronin-7 [Bagarius yarrelli]|uniref:Coronin n=1 Tax=Bagarius yarrelli TaxID=175774 RepID=A0A556TT33_BAGYA|nr:Coronin-7 [Bagarius yarrelli]
MAETYNCTATISCLMSEKGYKYYRLRDESTDWSTPSSDGRFNLSHTTNPFAEEDKPIVVFGEAVSTLKHYINTRYSFHIRDISSCSDDQTDLLLPDSSVSKDSDAFLQTWALGECEETVPEVCEVGVAQRCELLASEVFSECHNLVPVQDYVATCRKVACHPSMVCDLLAAYSNVCRQQGVCVPWRTSDLCPMTCSKNMEYVACRTGCIEECGHSQSPLGDAYWRGDGIVGVAQCWTTPTEGCFCPPGTVLQGEECVSQSACTPVCGLCEILVEKKESKCCPEYECVCRKDQCPVTKPSCPVHKKLLIKQTDCCDSFECVCSCQNITQVCPPGYITKEVTNECGCVEVTCLPDRVGENVMVDVCTNCTEPKCRRRVGLLDYIRVDDCQSEEKLELSYCESVREPDQYPSLGLEAADLSVKLWKNYNASKTWNGAPEGTHVSPAGRESSFIQSEKLRSLARDISELSQEKTVKRPHVLEAAKKSESLPKLFEGVLSLLFSRKKNPFIRFHIRSSEVDVRSTLKLNTGTEDFVARAEPPCSCPSPRLEPQSLYNKQRFCRRDGGVSVDEWAWLTKFHGDSVIDCFEVSTSEPWLPQVSHCLSDAPTRGLTLVPKLMLDIGRCEVLRGMQLTDNFIIPISYQVPRKVPLTSSSAVITPSDSMVASRSSSSTSDLSSGFLSSSRQSSRAIQSMLGPSSKFRHIQGTVLHRDTHITNLRGISLTSPGECDGFSANKQWVAVPLAIAGGQIAVLELSQPGKLSDTALPTIQNSVNVADFCWDPFDPYKLVVAGDDAKIRVWKIPEGGLTETLTTPECVLKGHTEKIYTIKFHPHASGLLVSSSYDMTVRLWNLEAGCEVKKLSGHQDQIFGMAWSPNGKLLATVCKDEKVGPGPEGHRGGRVVWVCDGRYLLVSGFNCRSERHLYLFSAESLASGPVATVPADVSPSTLVPFYDADTSLVFLTGKGDTCVYIYEIVTEAPYFMECSSFHSSEPHKGLCFLPKTVCNVCDVEVARAVRLSKTSIEPVAFKMPRIRKEFFQDDVFPETVEWWESSLNAASWLCGADGQHRKISLCPKNMTPVSEASREVKVRKYPPSSVYLEEKTDEQKKEELLSAMVAKLENRKDPLPQELFEGVDEDEWAKYLAQVVVMGVQVVGRAFARALRQEFAGNQAAAEARGQAEKQSAAVSSFTGMSLQEAQQILNVSTLKPEEIQKSFDHLFKVNEKAVGGSFYLLSKVVRAKERLDEEIAIQKQDKPGQEQPHT